MRDHELLLPVSNPTKSVTHLQVDVYYDKGELSGRRGYKLSVSPLGLPGDGSRVYSIGMGRWVQLEDAARLSRPRLAALADKVQADVAAQSGPAWEMVKRVLDDCGLSLAGAEPQLPAVAPGLEPMLSGAAC